MGKRTSVSIVQRRLLNQAVIHLSRIPPRVFLSPPNLVRALRSALRMSQAQLARRSGIPQAHIARFERGATSLLWPTMVRLFEALFCDAAVIALPRKRPSEALGERLGAPWD